MQFTVVQRILGVLLSFFSLTLLPPMLIAWFSQDNSLKDFLSAFFIILSAGLLLWFPVRNIRNALKLRDGFIIVVLFWIGLGLTGAIPFFLSEALQLNFTDAVFESLSGLTTTGATIITHLDNLPKSILFYRQELQWLGGMGIIVLAVAILPILGVGGIQLYRAEAPGPIKDSKLQPRITETAKSLWYIYLSLTISCCLCYWLAGMTFFDAISHSFSTVSIGGFSTHDASIGYFDNLWIKATAIIFMFASGINFALHFFAWKRKNFFSYWQDTEFRSYLNILLVLFLISYAYILYKNTDANHAGILTTLINTLFQSISIATTTGFITTEYYNWPGFLSMLLLFASFLGACAGSTGGGIKIIRVLLLFKQGMREIKQLIHPHAIFFIKINRKPIPRKVVNTTWGFFVAYIITFVLLKLILMATGLDMQTAFSAVAACLNNLGPGLGDVHANYSEINNTAKWVLCFAMLLGRLEIFTLLILLFPVFWRK